MESKTYQEHLATAEKLVIEASELMQAGMDDSTAWGPRMIMRADALNGIAQTHIMLAQMKSWLDSGERAID